MPLIINIIVQEKPLKSLHTVLKISLRHILLRFWCYNELNHVRLIEILCLQEVWSALDEHSHMTRWFTGIIQASLHFQMKISPRLTQSIGEYDSLLSDERDQRNIHKYPDGSGLYNGSDSELKMVSIIINTLHAGEWREVMRLCEKSPYLTSYEVKYPAPARLTSVSELWIKFE